jgi:hypothetical protein
MVSSRKAVYHVPMLKKKVVGKTKRKGIRILTGPISFATPRYKDACYGPLTKDSQAQAADAHSKGTLDLLDGKLRCDCGKMVGAKQSTMGSYFEPSPRPHERYKERPRPALKPGGGKR